MSLKRDTLYNFIGFALPLVAAALTIPFLLKNLGEARFGTLTMIWALIGYFGIFDLGVGRAVTYEVSRNIGIQSDSFLSQTIKGGLFVTCLTGLIGGLGIYFVLAPHSAVWFKIPPNVQQDVTQAFEIVALGVFPTALNSGIRGALEGFSRFIDSSVNRSAIGIAMFALPAASIKFGASDLTSAAMFLVGGRYLICLVGMAQLRRFIFNKAKFSLAGVRALLGFGVWVTLSGIVSPIMSYGDRFFVSTIVGAQALVFYAIPQEGLNRLLLIPAALTVALMPRLTIMVERTELKKNYDKYIKNVAKVMFCVCLIAALIAKKVLMVWMSADFADNAIVIVFILCAGLWFNSIAQLPMTLLHAVGKPKAVATIHIAELLCFVVLTYSFTKMWGIVGSALAWSARVTIDFFLLHYFANKEMK